MVVVPSLFFFHVEPSLPVMVEPAAAELTKFLPLSEPIEYEPPLPVAAIEAPDEPEDEDRYLFPPLWLVGKMKQEDQHESL